MKISIITVVYNNSKTIRDAISSVLSQTYKNVEYIIIDGDSTDGTKEIILNMREHISVFVSERDKGIYDAMNKGVSLATGDVIGILNSDDLYADNTVLYDIMDCFREDSDLSIVYGDLVYVKNAETKKVVRNWVSKPYTQNFFENGNVPPHPTLFVRSSVYKEVGKFDLQYKLAADYEFMLRTFKRHTFKTKYLKRLIVRMRLGGATNKNFKNIISGNKEIIGAWKKNGLQIPVLFMPLRIIKRLAQFF